MDRQTLLHQGSTAYAAGNLTEAEASYRAILAHTPHDAETLSNLGAVLTAAQCHDAAEQACRAALDAAPGYWAALANLGNALHRQRRYAEAVNAYHASLESNPSNASAWTNLGVALNEQWAMNESITAHDAALNLAPNDPQIRCNRAMALLIAGKFAEGFAEFEWRWRTPGMAPHGIPQPAWNGEDPDDKRILLHAEGGFGDTLHFIRYARMLVRRGATVSARVQTPLLRLLRRNFPEITFFDGGFVPPFDLHCPMLSLPRAFRTTLETVPAETPYLRACNAKSAAWRTGLASLGAGLRVGLVWEGAKLLGVAEFRAMNTRRSIPAAQFGTLAAIPGVHLVSLQYAASPDAARFLPLFDPMAGIGDFDDTAALIGALDLVITVDSAVAHLAGALGKPVWVLSRFDSCWRWLANRPDSPWYPTLRLYRQTTPGDWRTVIQTVAQDLRQRARAPAHAA